jgi:chromosome segregation ATPase
VLDQEEAKKFLTGKGEEKYAFFMKATELERMDRTYASIADSVMELSDTNDRIKDGLSKTFDHVAELKRKWEQHQQIEKLERKLEGYKSQYAWAYYTTVDDEYSGAMESLKKFQEKAGRYETELSQAEEALSSPSNEQEEKKKHHEALLEEAQNQTALRRELEEQLKQAHAPCKQIDRQLKALSRDTKSAVKTLAAAKKRLQEARDQILAQAGSAQSEEARRTAILKRTEEELAEARSKVDELRQTQSKYLRAYEEVEPHVLDARSKVSQVSNQLNGVNASIRELESASGDSLAVFGRNVPKLHQLVCSFHDDPTGLRSYVVLTMLLVLFSRSRKPRKLGNSLDRLPGLSVPT